MSLLSYTFDLIIRWCYSVRSWCSLRRLVRLLPEGPPAPRLELSVRSVVHGTVHELSNSLNTDELYTTTTSLTDFEDEDVRLTFNMAHTSTPHRSRSKYYGVPLRSQRYQSDHYMSDTTEDSYQEFRAVCSEERPNGSVSQYDHIEFIRAGPGINGRPRSQYRNHPMRKRKFREKRAIQSSVESAAPNEADQAERLAHLEAELAHLRSQLAQLVLKQEGNTLLCAPILERLDGDGESDTGPVCTVETKPMFSESAPPTKPPSNEPPLRIPPPPPLMKSSKPVVDWRAQLIASRNKKNAIQDNSESRPASSGSADMGQVLRELQSGSIKLRPVPRSPGGTPIREKKHSVDRSLDPCSIIARAMQNKFTQIRAALDLSTSGGENTPNCSTQQSGPDASGVLSPVRDGKCTATPPMTFGQHTLKSVPSELQAHVINH